MNKNKKILFNKLVDKLKEQKAFWSYEQVSNIPDISESFLIEKVLLLLDLEEINILFKIYDKETIRKVWEQNILSQEPYYHGLNKFIAWYYFDIENEDDYIKNFITERNNNLNNL